MSLPSLLNIDHLFETGNQTICNSKEVATQTINPSEIDENCSPKKSLLLKSQLTRDSGIDSDNPQNQQVLFKKSIEVSVNNSELSKKTDLESKMKTVLSSTRDNSIDQDNLSSIEDPVYLENNDDILHESFYSDTQNNRLPRRSFDNAASSRRQMFRNTSNKHHTVDVSSILRRPANIIFTEKLEDNLEMIQEEYKKHLELIESSKPVKMFFF